LIQATAADAMRLTMILATEADVCVCTVLHDGFLIEADADKIDAEVARMCAIMDQASMIGGRRCHSNHRGRVPVAQLLRARR
jgi:hypothetical protein